MRNLKKAPRRPRTPGQWQEAVNAADYLLRVHSAVLFGLVTTDFQIDVARCEALLEEGRQLGFVPGENE